MLGAPLVALAYFLAAPALPALPAGDTTVLAEPGVVQRLTPSIEALYVPNIDEALDEEAAKRAFWSSFRVLGEWYADLPPW